MTCFEEQTNHTYHISKEIIDFGKERRHNLGHNHVSINPFSLSVSSPCIID